MFALAKRVTAAVLAAGALGAAAPATSMADATTPPPPDCTVKWNPYCRLVVSLPATVLDDVAAVLNRLPGV